MLRLVARYRHFRNLGESGDTVFATTTVLDFARVFDRPRLANLMTASLLADCRHYESVLHAFVVMPHHIHVLLKVPDGKEIGWLMNRLKSASARRIVPKLSTPDRKAFASQIGLNRHRFWKESYRSFAVDRESEFAQKLGYIHDNPVRASLSARQEDYRWSSAPLWEEGLWSDERGLDITDALIERYCPLADLVIPAGARKPSSAGAAEG